MLLFKINNQLNNYSSLYPYLFTPTHGYYYTYSLIYYLNLTQSLY